MLRIPHLRVRWLGRFINASQPKSNISSTATVEHVTIPCSANGSITIDIHRPTASISSGHPRVILFLPHGLLSATATNFNSDVNIASHLTRTASATTVHVHYRLSSSAQYPTPVYDVLRAYDWILTNLLPKHQSQYKAYQAQSQHGYGHSRYAPPRPQQAKLGVYGESIGGSLAMMLALTECKTEGQAGRIAAAAFRDPIVDWTAFMTEMPLETTASMTPKRKRKATSPRTMPDDNQTSPSHNELHKTLTTIFPASNPSSYFSPFASPIHFLRTPATAVPTSLKATSALDPTATDFDILAALEADDLASRTLHATSRPLADEAETRSIARRKVPLRYPPSGLAPMAMPDLRVRVSGAGALREQNEEMVRLLRRAWLKYDLGMLGSKHEAEVAKGRILNGSVEGGEDGAGDGDGKDMLERAAEAKVVLDVDERINRGDNPKEETLHEEEYIEKVGDWFAKALR